MGGGAVRDSEVGEEGLWQGNRARTSSPPVFCNSSLELMTTSSKQKADHLHSRSFHSMGCWSRGSHSSNKKMKQPTKVIPENRYVPCCW